MKTVSTITTLLCLLCIVAAPAQRDYPLWKSLPNGPHRVGFQTINFTDSSRNIKPRVNEAGALNEDRFFPVQISVWYPTDEIWKAERALPFEEYFFRTAQKNDFAPLTKEQQATATDIFFSFAKYGLKLELEAEDIQQLRRTATAALPDAVPLAGPFPTILAGHDGGVWKMSTLCEFLASHGYVIISTGPLSETSRMYSNNAQGAINRRIRTYEIIRAMLDRFPYVDPANLGLIGLNSDGMSALLYQMKNQETKALVSIDGWEGKNNGNEYVRNSIYFDPDAMRVPLLEFHQHEPEAGGSLQLNSGIFDSLTVDRISYVLQDFGHAYLTGNMIAFPTLEEEVIRQHHFWYTSILSFFNAYLKGETASEQSLWEEPELNGSLIYKQQRVKEE